MVKSQYSYEQYYDKILGCFMGKCICGTMGAPYEGMKQFLNLQYDKTMIQKAIPNDDLDIQLIWLEILEKYGEYFSSIDLAEAFYHGYPHSPGEYAYFKKNFERKIYPPASGSFCNDFYENGMGSPIRSEIWACVNPVSPLRAAEMAAKDGCLDHKHDSIVAEEYFAAMQAMAFAEEDIFELLERSQVYLAGSEKLCRLYRDVVGYYHAGYNINQIRELIIREYGHPDCTNLYQNVGIIWSALLLGKGDIINTTMLAINCGFDTDCTAATVGAILGILWGGSKLREVFDVSEVYYIAEALVNREDNRITTLSRDIARVGVFFSKQERLNIEITGFALEDFAPIKREYLYEVKYHGDPVLSESNSLTLIIKNLTDFRKNCTITPVHKSGYDISVQETVILDAKAEVEVPVHISQVQSETGDEETEVFTVCVSSSEQDRCLLIEFGLCRGVRYKIYGPYWENHVTVPQLRPGENYYKYLGDEDEIREYHLSVMSNFDAQYISEGDFEKLKLHDCLSKEVTLTNSRFNVSDLFGFEGPCVAYMARTIHCEEIKECMLYVGKSDKIKIWLNDRLILQDETIGYCTCENRHLHPIVLNKGQNNLLIKLARSSHEAVFSLLFIEEGEVMSFPKQIPM